MKKFVLLLAALSTVTTTALAGGHYNQHRNSSNYSYYNHHNSHNSHNTHHNSNNWIAPLLVGGAIGYVTARAAYAPSPQPVYYEQVRQCNRVLFLDGYNNVIREEQRCN